MIRSRILSSLAAFMDATRAEGLRMVIAFSDESGILHCLWREPGAWLGSNDIAINKAWTAAAFSGRTEEEGMSTAQLGEMSQPGQPLYGIQDTNRGQVVVFPGGVPIYEDDKLVGGIGVSGGSVDNDQRFAELALKAYLDAKEQEDSMIEMPIGEDLEIEDEDEEDDQPLDDAQEPEAGQEPESESEAETEEETETEEEPVEAALTDAPADDDSSKDKEDKNDKPDLKQ